MKVNTLKKKSSRILHANRRQVRVNGQNYLIRVQSLGGLILADAEPVPQGGIPINLFDKTNLARQIRADVENNLFR